jgi:hypothetical protein
LRSLQDKEIHAGAQEAIKRLFRRADDWLILIEGRVEHHRNSGERAKTVD